MIHRIEIENFRSIEQASLELAPLVLIYGPTASGKSSLLYALRVLRNFVVDPTRPADGFFHLGFMDLGGFDECVFNHEKSRTVEITIHHEKEERRATYKLSLSRNGATIRQTLGEITLQSQVPIPYGLNQTFPFTYTENEKEYQINWNGIFSSVSPKQPMGATQEVAIRIARSLNVSAEVIKAIDIVPHRRGFFKPNYAPVPVSAAPTSEDEVASLVLNDRDLAARISVYSEAILGRDFRLHVPPGTATAFFQTTDKQSRTPTLLVNDGFGVNQVVYLLAKILRSDVQTVLIEEPEVHLHPTAARNLARELCTIVKEEGKQIVLTTHSELFVSSILASVRQGIISSDEIKCYLCTRERRRTEFKLQRVQKNGQIEGGLGTFVEAELEDLKTMLGIKE